MYLIPLVRTGRIVTSCLLFPEHQVEAMAISEVSSYIIPFFNYPSPILNIINFSIYLFCDLDYTKYLMNEYLEKNKFLYKIEFILLWYYILYYKNFIHY
jgi:hypothetical protein